MANANEMRTLSWKHGLLQVHSLGGMIGPGLFLMPDGKQISPFHVAPWWNEPASEQLDGLHRGLRGEWPCVPFGYPMPKAGFPEEWQSAIDDEDNVSDVHGYGSNNHWQFCSALDDAEVSMFIDYPDDHDVTRLERHIRPVADTSAIEFELKVSVRRPCRLPMALHGSFSVPNVVGALDLVPGDFETGFTHPSTVEPGASLFAPHRQFTDLKSVPGLDGRSVDASRLPFKTPVEELLQLNRCDGTFELINRAENYRMVFEWDADILPSVLLWYSNYGRAGAPWSSRNLNIGIEPTASAFGLSPDTSAAQNPINAKGTPTAVALSPKVPTVIRYKMAFSALPRGQAQWV